MDLFKFISLNIVKIDLFSFIRHSAIIMELFVHSLQLLSESKSILQGVPKKGSLHL